MSEQNDTAKTGVVLMIYGDGEEFWYPFAGFSSPEKAKVWDDALSDLFGVSTGYESPNPIDPELPDWVTALMISGEGIWRDVTYYERFEPTETTAAYIQWGIDDPDAKIEALTEAFRWEQFPIDDPRNIEAFMDQMKPGVVDYEGCFVAAPRFEETPYDLHGQPKPEPEEVTAARVAHNAQAREIARARSLAQIERVNAELRAAAGVKD